MNQTPTDLARLRSLDWLHKNSPLSPSSWARAIRRGELVVVRVGGRTLVDERDVLAFFAAKKQRGPDHSPLPADDDDPAGTGSTVEEHADAPGDSFSD